MSPLIQYDPALPSPPVNLLEGAQSEVTTSRKRSWFKAQWAISPSGAGNIVMTSFLGLLILFILDSARTEPFAFWYNVSTFAVLSTMLVVRFYQTVIMTPKIWRQNAQSASEQLDEGGVVLVLGSNVGAPAIPFAEQVVNKGMEKNTIFVCIDRFLTRWSWPYSATTLLKNLLAVGLPPQSIIAHKASSRWGYKDSPSTSLIEYDHLPFQSSSISLVIADQPQCEYKWAWFTRPNGKIYDEIVRVLQPGGKAVIAEIRPVDHLVSECEQKGWTVEKRAGRTWFEYTKHVLADIKFQDEKDIEKAV